MLIEHPLTDIQLPLTSVGTGLTVHEAALAVRSWSDLSATRRRDLASALSSVARLVGLPPDAVTLTPAALRPTLLARSAASFGLSESRYKNLLSAVRYVLRRLGMIDSVPPYPEGLWKDLIDKLSVEARRGLMTFSRYCSSEGIQPQNVDVDTLRKYEVWLAERNLCARPKKSAGDVRSAWNRAVKSIPDWPQRPLEQLRQRGQYVLPLESFPTAFQDDLAAFGRRLGATGFDDAFPEEEEEEEEEEAVDANTNAPSKPKKPCRASTVALRKSHARWAASALVATGVHPDDIFRLSDLVTPVTRARAIFKFLYDRTPGGKSAAGMHVGEVLLMIAKYHVKSPAADVKKIVTWVERVKLDYSGMTEKNENCIRQAMDPKRMANLRALPRALMKSARAIKSENPKRAASLALRATAIAFLTCRPIRISNLIGLRLDGHLQRANPPRGPITHFSIQINETKNETVISLPISQALSEILQDWIDNYRPIVAGPGCTYLFPGHGTGNRSMCRQGMHEAIKTTMISHLGISLNPHRFRHLAARVFLQEYPGEYETVRRLLGHKDINSTIRAYCGTEVESATDRFDEILSKGLASTRKPGRPATKDKSSKFPIQGGYIDAPR
jgi:site-specific recombinase XerD